jgi:hypothetical protein
MLVERSCIREGGHDSGWVRRPGHATIVTTPRTTQTMPTPAVN